MRNLTLGLLLLIFTKKEAAFVESSCNRYITRIDSIACSIYHADPAQCDSDYLVTANGFRIDTTRLWIDRTIAVSRDYPFKIGDTIEFLTPYKGKWVVRDKMNKRHKNKIDFLVPKYLRYVKPYATFASTDTVIIPQRLYL